MYLNPVLLPQFTNREDLTFPVSIFDDDTGQPVNLSGTTGSGTFSNWTVTDGAIVTTSNTTLTIPQFPIGNQLSAVSAIVGTGLGILATDPIVFADPSGLNTMIGYVLSYVPATGAIVFQVGFTFQLEVRRQQHSGARDDTFGFGGYSNFPAIGVYDRNHPEIIASLGNGLMIVDIGVVMVNIPEVTVRKLRHDGTRRIGMTATDSVNTRQVFIAQLPVLSGGVTN